MPNTLIFTDMTHKLTGGELNKLPPGSCSSGLQDRCCSAGEAKLWQIKQSCTASVVGDLT